MNGLAFLTPAADKDSVVARTPMERLASAAGARLERRAGWNVAVAYGGDPAAERLRLTETVGFADRSQLIKLELHAAPETLAEIVREAGDGLELELGRAGRTPGAWWCPVTPSRLLLLLEPGVAVGERLGSAVRDERSTVTIVDITCGLAAMALVGPGSGELLARFSAIDVRSSVTPVAGFRPGSIARTPGYLLREAEDQLLLLVGWAFGEYLWQVVADAADQLGGGPVGTDALAALVESAHA